MRKFVAIWIGLALIGCGGNGDSGKSGDSSGASGGPDASRPPTQAITGDPTQVVAEVGGKKITLAEVDRVVQAIRTGRARDVDPTAPLAVLQQKAVDNLVEQSILVIAAKDKGIVPSEEELATAISQIKSRFPNEEAFATAIGQQGMTPEQFDDSFRSDLTIRNFVQKAFTDTVVVTPEQARSYYDSNPDEFMNPESVHARHILMRLASGSPAEADQGARERAEAALVRLRGGEDFIKVASEVSEDETTQARGGDLGFFGPGAMVAPFDTVAFSLEIGQISDLVKTQFGYHIIKVEEKRPPGPLAYDEISAPLLQKLQQDRVNDHVTAFIASQRSKVKVKREI